MVTSDHASLTIELRHVQELRKPFRFTNSLLKNENLREVVARTWDVNVSDSIMYKFTENLDNVKRVLEGWRRSKSQAEKAIIEAEEELRMSENKLSNSTNIYNNTG